MSLNFDGVQNKSSRLIVMIVKETFMRFHIQSYLTSVIVVIAVMLSPNVGMCIENMDAELEPDEICCVQSRRDEAEIMLPETSNLNVRHHYHHYQRATFSSIIQSSRTSAHGFSVLYCIFRE